MFLRNFWYVAAWDTEVRRQELMRRTICDEPIVLWRQEDGTPAALEDRCCHRHMPLSEGNLKGSNIECSYHGLTYDASGACVHIPSQVAIPPKARVRSFPVVERNHWIWIWMGDPALADPDLIEDFHWMDDPDWRAKGELMEVKGSYLLMVDNLLDLTHLQFVHPTTLGTSAISGAPINTEVDGNRVRVTRWILDSPPPPFFQKAGGFGADEKIDRWQIIDFSPPGFVRLDVGGAKAGTGAPEGDRSQGFSMRNLNALTPETADTTHYFWAQAHDFRIDDPTITELLYQQVHKAFLEDLTVIQAQQANRDSFGDSLPAQIDFNQDAGTLQARKVLESLIEGERARPAVRAAG